MSVADRLDAALDGRGPAPEALRRFVAAAAEVAEALAAERLTAAQRERILERSLRLVEHDLADAHPGRRGRWLRRSRPVVVGGAALVLAAAAITWGLVRGRRPPAPAPVALRTAGAGLR